MPDTTLTSPRLGTLCARWECIGGIGSDPAGLAEHMQLDRRPLQRMATTPVMLR